MNEILLDQGTPNWLAWRAGKEYADVNGTLNAALSGPRITATAASVCGGHSPFSKPHELWGEMLGLRQRQVANFVMQRGSTMEPIARKAYTEIVGEDYEAICVESVANPWIAASLDGVDLLRTRGVEIKCPISQKTHDLAMLGEVPKYYYDQIQWQMLATDNQLTEIDYFSFAPQIGTAMPITVRVDLVRQAELVDASMKLRLAVMTKVPISGPEFDQAGKAFLMLNRKMKELEIDLEIAKERLKLLADGKPTHGGGVMVTVSKSDGRTSWEKIAQHLIETHGISIDEVENLKLTCKSKPTTTISIKEAGDADAVFAELIAIELTENSHAMIQAAEVNQPQPIW